MARNIPTAILGTMAGVAISMSSGFVLASYVVAGTAPAYSAPPRTTSMAPRPIDADWPVPDYASPHVFGGDR